ncbi:MAG: MBOAT family protein [Aquimonas sp.]|nr:MBOAT family protein [Aquimonas sp.]
MQFDSLTFLVFFALVLGSFALLPTWRAQKQLLLWASYLFYAAWNPPFVLLLIASSSFDWWLAQKLPGIENRARRRLLLGFILGTHLLVLGYFKYSAFMLENLAALLALGGVAYQPPPMSIVLPVGISFYTFHSLSYCFDVYRGRITPTRSWLDYSLYVAFFPQLVAGPIVRWTQMGHQIESPRHLSSQGLGLGLALLCLGLFQKVVLADAVFAPVANAVFDAESAVGTRDAWLGMLAFSGQIFCDFAGYSTCALGAALALGFVLPVNFRNPYAAIGFSDFWRRWHISLSSWLRDYLYISLGGNRVSLMRRHGNLMATMLIGGLWHGASWNFVAWGGLHGAYLVLEHGLRQRLGLGRDPAAYPLWLKLAYGGLTLLGVMYAWIWFRSRSFTQGWELSLALGGGGPAGPSLVAGFDTLLALATFALLLAVHARWREVDARDWLARLPTVPLALLLAFMLTLILLSPGDGQAFIYFQF